MNSNKLLRTILALALPALAVQTNEAPAAILLWDGGTANLVGNGDGTSAGGAGTWDTTILNWDQGAGLPYTNWNNAAGNSATFGGAAGTVTLGAGITANALNFNTTGYTLANNTLTLGGGAPSITVSGTATTINSILAGTDNVTKAGTGILRLGGTNTFSGGLTINNGPTKSGSGSSGTAAVQVNTATALGSGPVTIGGAVNNLRALEFNLTGGAVVTNAINLPTSGATQVGIQGNNNSSYCNLSGQISGGYAGLTFFFDMGNGASSGVTKLSNLNNNFLATLYFNRGVLAITGDGCLGNSANVVQFDQTANQGGLRFDQNNINILHAIQWISRCDFNVNGNDATISSDISGNGNDESNRNNIKGGVLSGGNSVGSLRLSGNNTMLAPLTVAINTKLIAASSTALGSASGTTLVQAGGTLSFDTVGTYANAEPVTLNGAGVINGGAAVGALENLAGVNEFDGPITLASASAIGATAGNLTLGGSGITGGFGITKVGGGTLTLNTYNSYTGNTTVGAGTLALGASGLISSSPVITVAPGAVLDLSAATATFASGQTLVAGRASGFATDVIGPVILTGGTISPVGGGAAGTLTVNGGLNLQGGALNFDLSSPGGTNDVIAINGQLNLSGSTTINVNWLGGTPQAGTYTLVGGGSSLGSGDTNNLVLGSGLASSPRVSFALDTASTPGSVKLIVTGGAANLAWTGANGSAWDVATTTNWLNGANPDVFYNSDVASFQDGAATGNVTIDSAVSPSSTLVSNTATAYSFSGAAGITSGDFIKAGSGSLSISNYNSFTATPQLNGGTVLVNDFLDAGSSSPLGAGSAIAMNGGTLVVANGFSANRALTFNAGGGTIQNDNALTLAGTISGPGVFQKTGAGTLSLTGGNTGTGGTVIGAGILEIGDGGGLGGGTVADGAVLSFNRAGNLTVTNSITGAGSLQNNNTGVITLTASNSFAGGALINSGRVVITSMSGVGTNAVNAASGGALGFQPVNGSTNTFANNVTLPSIGTSEFQILGAPTNLTTVRMTGVISGGAAGQMYRINDTEVTLNHNGCVVLANPNNSFQGILQIWRGVLAFTSDAALGDPANVIEVDMENNNGALRFDADNLTISAGRSITLGYTTGDSIDVQGFNGTVACPIGGTGIFNKKGTGTLTLTAANTYTSSTTIAAGTLLVNGSLASTNVAVAAGTALGGSGTISGEVDVASGGAILGGDAGYSNTLTVATLDLGAGAGDATTSKFTVAAGGTIAATTLNVSGVNTIQILDPTLTIGTNTLFTYTGTIGGTNGFAGFQLGALPPGVAANLLNTGTAVQLAVTSLTAVNTNSPVLTNSVSGNTLTLSWPADHLGWRLEVQTNALNVGLTGNWATWPNSTNVTTVPVTIDPANPTLFFRLVYP